MTKKYTILLVDDDQILIDMYAKKMTNNGYEILSANNGKEGLAMALEKKPDLILSDLVMPDMDGFDFLKKIKSNSEIKNIPVIVLTNLSSEEDKNNALKLGAEKYFLKIELTPAQLIEELKEILN